MRIEGRHHQNVGGESHRSRSPRHRDHSILQGLSQGVDGGGRELGEFVEQQDSSVGQAHLPGAGHRSASDQRCGTAGVMRSSKRRCSEAVGFGRFSRDRTDHRGLQGGFVVQRREDFRQSTGQHGLSTTRGAHEQEIVPTGRGDLGGPTRRGLTTDPIKAASGIIRNR